jgi:hypothetical protein
VRAQSTAHKSKPPTQPHPRPADIHSGPAVARPVRDGMSLTSQNLYWRLRAACYHRVPGVVRFYDTNSLPRLVEDQGLTVVECNSEPGRVSVLGTRMTSLVESALQRRVRDTRQ